MTTLTTMYQGQTNSPATTLASNITASATSITVTDASALPAVPFPLTIGINSTNSETVLVTAKSSNTLTVTRGWDGTAAAWNADTPCARVFTAKDLNTVESNITALNTNKAEQSDVTDAVNDLWSDIYANTASGPIANFYRTVGGLPVDDLTIDINPVQAGTGDPSPTNVRAISGWTGATIYQSGADTSDPSTTSISWQTEAGTVYGGTLDVTTGLLTVTHKRVDMGSFTWSYSSGGSGRPRFQTTVISDIKVPASNREIPSLYCEVFSTTYAYDLYTTSSSSVGITINTDGRIWVHEEPMGTDATAFKTAVTGYYVVYPLAAASQTTYQLTQTEVAGLLGENNIWADTGDVYVQFGADIKSYIDNTTGGKQDKIFASGILKGNGSGGVSAAVAGTDYQAPLTAGTDYQTPIAEEKLQYYGVCSTAASTQAKTVTIDGITALTTGLEIRVKMTNAQTYNGTPTLNVNSLGAKSIMQHGSVAAVRYQWQAGEVVSLTYDGTYWVLENNSLATTTYFGLTRLSSSTSSTAEDSAATPKAVKTAYDLAAAAVPSSEKDVSVATLATASDSTTPTVPRLTPSQGFAPIFEIDSDTTLAAKHAGGILVCTNSPTITIPVSVFDAATEIEIFNYGTGIVTVAGASGVSLNGASAGSKQIKDQYTSGVLLAISASQWVIQGAIE